MIHKRSNTLEWSVKYFTEGLKRVSQLDNPLSSFRSKTLFDIVTCTFFKDADQF